MPLRTVYRTRSASSDARTYDLPDQPSRPTSTMPSKLGRALRRWAPMGASRRLEYGTVMRTLCDVDRAGALAEVEADVGHLRLAWLVDTATRRECTTSHRYEFRCESCWKGFEAMLTLPERANAEFKCPNRGSENVTPQLTVFTAKTSQKSSRHKASGGGALSEWPRPRQESSISASNQARGFGYRS
jgi:hypothetical protein